MNALAALAPAAQALLRHLVWEVWFSTLVFGAVALAAAFLPRRHCRLRQMLWMLVLCRLVLPVGLATPASMWRPVGLRAAGASPSWSGASGPAEALPAAAAPVAAIAALGVAAPGPSGDAGSRLAARVALPVALAWSWIGGVLLVGCVLARRRRHFRGIARRALPVADPWLLGRADHWRGVMGVRRPVRLLQSDDIKAPFTVGSVAPGIVLPTRLARAGESALADCVLAHEMAHVRGWDDLALQIQAAIAALYFFHPVAWLAFRFSRDEADRACDQIVVARGRIPARTYGASLVASVSGGGVRVWLDPIPALAPTLRQVRARLEVLVYASLPVPGRLKSLAAAVAFGVVLQPVTHRADRCSPSAGSSEPSGVCAGAPRSAGAPLPSTASRVASVGALLGQGSASPFANPLPTLTVTARFGVKQRLPNIELRRHRGVDMGAALGTPVRAAARGVVAFAGDDFEGEPDLGRVVVVNHGGGLSTLYGHLDAVAVARGVRVEPGAAIGTVGSTGYSLGPHLHFEVRRDGVPVCPSALAALLRARGGGPPGGTCGSRRTPARSAV